MSTLTVKVSDKVLESIATEAKRRGITKTKVIQERLELSAEVSLWDRMKDLVIDSDKLPGDLSTNKKHMEGYGKSRHSR